MLLTEAKQLQETIVGHRRYLHQNAEVGLELPKTSTYVIKELKAMGYVPELVGGHGIVALVGKKKEGKTILLRADMDALPMSEASGESFSCESGAMHACGHDLHTSMLLGAAKLLKDHEDEINGQVKLMFQPGEEIFSGAKKMIEAGVLENPKVDAGMMIHVFPGMPFNTGSIIIQSDGVICAASDWFKITVQGKGGHGAMPNMCVDPINVATHIYMALQNINARELDPNDVAVLTVGELHGGGTGNIIPDTAYMQGTVRTFDEKVRSFIKERMTKIATSIAESFRATAEVEFFRGCPCNLNDKDLREEISGITSAFLEQGKVLDASVIPMLRKPVSGSEDFAYIAQEIPTVMLGLSAGSSLEGYTYSAHHPKVRFDEKVLAVGAAVYANSAIEWLKK